MVSDFSSYTAFKSDFYGQITDLSLFDCQDFNLLKVVLEGLKVDYIKRGITKSRLFSSLPVYRFVNTLKRIKTNSNNKSNIDEVEVALKNFAKAPLLIISGYDLETDGKKSAKYYDPILKTLAREEFILIHDSPLKINPPGDVDFKKILQLITILPLSKSDRQLRQSILDCFERIRLSRNFTSHELTNIQIAFEKFFNDYRTWNWILNHIHPSKAIFRCHYHKEGTILAFRRHNIKCIELQHGLIAEEDIFYLFPEQIEEIKERVLFADRILVYGEYWKNLLKEGAEYSADQIDIIGYYHFIDTSNANEKPAFAEFIKGRKVVLVASQTSIHEAFIEYVSWLAVQPKVIEENWAILMKPHPNEPVELFSPLKKFSNVLLVTENIDFVLKHSAMVISCYSTVLYDAKRYNIPAYSLYLPNCKDYIKSYVDSGVSELLEQGHLPGNVSMKNDGKEASFFYANFNAEIIRKELLNKN